MCVKDAVRYVGKRFQLNTSFSIFQRVKRPFENQSVLDRSHKMVREAFRGSINEQRKRIINKTVSS